MKCMSLTDENRDELVITRRAEDKIWQKELEERKDNKTSDKEPKESMDKIKTYKTVFNDLKDIPLFTGIYDAKNGDATFMHGVFTVMECLAGKISEEEQDNFTDTFHTNMLKSERRSERKQYEDVLEFLKISDKYKDFTYLEEQKVFNELFKDRNYDLVQIYDMHPIHPLNMFSNDIVGFCGVFKWKDNDITPLDGDSYMDDMDVFGYKEFTTKDNEKALDILVCEW